MEIILGGVMGLFIVGGITVYWLYDGYRKAWGPYRHYQQAPCRVLEKGMARFSSDEGEESFKPEFKLSVLAADKTLRGYDLWAEGLSRSQAEAVLARYPLNQDLSCWQPPGRPEEAVLSRRPDIYWILCGMLFLPLTILFALMTGCGLYFWRTGSKN